MRFITHAVKGNDDLLAVVTKARSSKSPDVFEHDRAWACFFDQSQRRREQVTFIVSTKLFASDREGRAWDASRE